jgi:hypothetical protein
MELKLTLLTGSLRFLADKGVVQLRRRRIIKAAVDFEDAAIFWTDLRR